MDALLLNLKSLYNVRVNLKMSGFRMFVHIWRIEARGKLPCSLEAREGRSNTVKNQPWGREAPTNIT